MKSLRSFEKSGCDYAVMQGYIPVERNYKHCVPLYGDKQQQQQSISFMLVGWFVVALSPTKCFQGT
jgi:hypothetical protein